MIDERDQQFANVINLGKNQQVFDPGADEEGRTGQWILRRPNLRDEVTIGIEYRRMLTPAATPEQPCPQPVELDSERSGMAAIIATLNVVVDGRPEWAPKDLGELLDFPYVMRLFEAYDRWLSSFRPRVSGEGGADRGASQPADDRVAV